MWLISINLKASLFPSRLPSLQTSVSCGTVKVLALKIQQSQDFMIFLHAVLGEYRGHCAFHFQKSFHYAFTDTCIILMTQGRIQRGGPDYIHNQFSPYMVILGDNWVINCPCMVKIDCEYDRTPSLYPPL